MLYLAASLVFTVLSIQATLSGEKRGRGSRLSGLRAQSSLHYTMEKTEGDLDYSEEAIHQRIEELCQSIEIKQRMVKLKREELRK